MTNQIENQTSVIRNIGQPSPTGRGADMASFRNEPLYVVTTIPHDASQLGISRQKSDLIHERGWTIVNAPRPLLAIWKGEGPVVEKGLTWESVTLNAWFFAAGLAEGEITEGKTLTDLWNEDDAYPVKLVTTDELEHIVYTVLDDRKHEGDDPQEIIDAYREMDGDEDAIVNLARDIRLRVFDRRFKRDHMM